MSRLVSPIFISVDVEVTDPDPAFGQLMQVGMASELGETIIVNLPVTTSAQVSDWVRANQGPLLAACWEIASFGVETSRNSAAVDLVAWVWKQKHDFAEKLDVNVSNVEAVFVAYCGGMDWEFTSRLFAEAHQPNPFNYEFVEISSLAIGRLNFPWGFTEAALEQHLCVASLLPELKHNALNDARHQLELFQLLYYKNVHETGGGS